jgi:signal peptidase I
VAYDSASESGPSSEGSSDETLPHGPAKARDHQRFWGTAAEVILLAVLVAFALVRPFILEPFYIPSNSMYPELRAGDRIFVSKLAYRLGEPERDEVIVFYGAESSGWPDEIFVKRVIALPGEHISINYGKTYVEGFNVQEPFLKYAPYNDFGTYHVPPRSYFVMGDNRNDSRDSRYWGAVPRANLIGRAVMVFWPLNRVHFIH